MKNKTKIKAPQIGDKIYAPSSYYVYRGEDDLDVTFVIDRTKMKHKMHQADRSYEGGTISVEGNISLNAVVNVLIYNPDDNLIKLLDTKKMKYSIEAQK